METNQLLKTGSTIERYRLMRTESLQVIYTADGSTLTLDMDVEGVPYVEVLQAYINFLKGIGYEIPKEYNVV